VSPTKEELGEGIERLKQIKDEILQSLEEAENIITKLAGRKSLIHQRAESYWLAHATTAITKESRWLGGSMITMEDTMQELEKVEVEDTDMEE
jgi:hypothetical protein